ncbi:hypothetical protein GW816_00875 [Candidatus Wolfebacteria bacterium]|nr:hypothetical protein [Parcubacteria group bacterium]NCO89688.1 hypothetical protein [Candidatus Wolfebacteria bacterium]NCQ02600.1 hypothetical protein [Candidatus Wolfebacteria bacterium]
MLWFDNKNIAIIFSQKSDGDMLFKQSQIDADNKLTAADKLNEKVRANRISFF